MTPLGLVFSMPPRAPRSRECFFASSCFGAVWLTQPSVTAMPRREHTDKVGTAGAVCVYRS